MRPAWLKDDATRQDILDEIHARPVEFITVPSRIRRVAAILPREPQAVRDAQSRFGEWCRASGVTPPPPAARQHSFDVAGFHVTWELHTEFVTLSWAGPIADTENWPAGIGLELLDNCGLAAAVRVDIIAETTVPERIVSGFRLASLCSSAIDGGTGEIATDFVPDADGFIRFEFAATAFAPLRRAVIVRRLLEIETYRTLTLMALPIARAIMPDLARAEEELGAAISRLGDAHGERAEQSLATLQGLSVQSGQLIEATSFRFAASHAYGEILRRRLRSLQEVAINGASTLDRYLGNRIDPALATCLAVEKRQDALTSRIERGIELLDARISLDLQVQNKEILRTIAATSERQFQLQRTVEGLSVIAISYYLLGLASYALTGLSDMAHFSKGITTAALVPLVVGLVWFSVGRIRRMHSDA